MPIVRADRGKSVVRTVREVFVLNTYVKLASQFTQTIGCKCCIRRRARHYVRDLHPSIPPLPVTKTRSLQSSGSHNSNDMLDLLDVGMESATRQMFTVTS